MKNKSGLKIRSSVGLFAVFISAAMLCSCSDDGSANEMPENINRIYNAACQKDTLRLAFSSYWHVEASPEWISLDVKEANGDIIIPINIQQNDEELERSGELIISLENKQTFKVHVTQTASDNNGGYIIDLPNYYGLGWGYDLREDIADISGVRGQIFDSFLLRNDWGEDAIVYDNNVNTNLNFVKGESSETIQKKLASKIEAGADFKVASAKVSVEYNNQITEQKDRLYVWCRDYRSVRMAYFGNDVDIYDKDVIENCTTCSFRKSVQEDSPTEIVRKFGTHLVTGSSLGGKLDYYFTVSSDITTEVEKIITTVNVKVLCFKASNTWVDEKVWQEVKKSFQGNFIVSGGGRKGDYLNSQLKQYASKGEPLTDPTLFDSWYDCFKGAQTAKDSELAMVDFTIVPIWRIIEAFDADKANSVESYIKKYYLQ